MVKHLQNKQQKSGCQSIRTIHTVTPLTLGEKWNIDLFTTAGGEADVQPSLLPAYLTMPPPICQALFSEFFAINLTSAPHKTHVIASRSADWRGNLLRDFAMSLQEIATSALRRLLAMTYVLCGAEVRFIEK